MAMQGRSLVVAGGVALLLGAGALLLMDGDPARPSAEGATALTKTVQDAVAAAEKKAQSAPAPSVGVYQTILPSLVVIHVERGPSGGPGAGLGVRGGLGGVGGATNVPSTEPSASTPGSGASGETETALGTGVVINAQGAILTAHHVIADASTITVSFADGTTTTARPVTEDPDHDIAVLAPKDMPTAIVPAVLGGGVRVGDDTYAVGNPLGLTASMSAGVVSGLDRSIPVPGGRTLAGLIQFDASVNPGSSGGPLLNRAGQVVGIVTALANPSEEGGFVGIGFAVPINTAGGAAGGPRQ